LKRLLYFSSGLLIVVGSLYLVSLPEAPAPVDPTPEVVLDDDVSTPTVELDEVSPEVPPEASDAPGPVPVVGRVVGGDFRPVGGARLVVGQEAATTNERGLFRFEPDVTPSMETMNAMLERRKTTQPLGLPSCGSVFRNPPGDHSARLIEAAGLKGFRIGGAEVSEKHANFIINRDNATATDIEGLIEHVRQTVRDAHGVELIHEVRIVGEVPA